MDQMRRGAKAVLQLQGFLQEFHYFRGGTVTVLAKGREESRGWTVQRTSVRQRQGTVNLNGPAVFSHALINNVHYIRTVYYLLGADTEQ